MEKIVFFGASLYIIPVIDQLQKQFSLSLVVTTEMSPTDSVPMYCKKNNIPYLSVEKIDQEVIEKINNLHATVGALAYFGIIVPLSLLQIFPKGIINIHPSLLPKYKGPTPVQTAIKNGDTTTGITIIRLDEKVDHGPILEQREEEIAPTDTTDSLHRRLFQKGALLLASSLKNYLAGNLSLQAQAERAESFTEKLTRESGFVDTHQHLSPQELDRLIRAYFPWPGVWTRVTINNKEVVLKFLPEKLVQLEGKKPVDSETFYRGYPELKQLLQPFFVSSLSVL